MLIVKEVAVQFHKFKSVASTHSIPSDELIAQLASKLEVDIEEIGPKQYEIEEVTKMTKKIIANETHINNALSFLKEKQEDMCEFLIKYNSIKSDGGEIIEKEEVNNDFLNTNENF